MRKTAAEYSRDHRERLKKKLLCPRSCGRSTKGSIYIYCDPCREQSKLENKLQRQARKDAGCED